MMAEDSEIERTSLVFFDYVRSALPAYKAAASIVSLGGFVISELVYSDPIPDLGYGGPSWLNLSLASLSSAAFAFPNIMQLWNVYFTRDVEATKRWRVVSAIENFVVAGASIGVSVWGFATGGEAILIGAGMVGLAAIFAGMGAIELAPYPFERKSTLVEQTENG